MSASRELPNRWEWVEIGDVSLPGESWNPRTSNASAFSYIDIEAVDNKRQQISSPKALQVSEAPSRARVRVRKGDILFSLVRPYLKNIAVVPQELDGQVASTAFLAVRPARGVDSSFVFNYLLQDSFINSVPTYGNSPPAARDDEFVRLKIPLAPSGEQQRIASKVDELLSDLDAGVAALERARANLKRYRAAVLKAAVEGRLTAEWREAHPDAEPASKLLERILAERRKKWEEAQLAKFAAAGKPPPKGWKGKYSEPPKANTTNLPELPKGWVWVLIDIVGFVTKLAGFEYTKYVRYDAAGDLSVIKAENAGKLGFRRTDFSRVRSETVTHLVRSRVQSGDLLMVFVGAGTGNVARVPNDQPYFLGPNIAMIRITSSYCSGVFAELFLRSPIGHQLALSFAKAVAQPSLSMETIRKIPIALPPLHEQEAIINEVSSCLSVEEEAFREIDRGIARAGKLRQAILKRAFEGKLVPQDPNDEPASVLLERIRDARAASLPQPAHKRRKSPA